MKLTAAAVRELVLPAGVRDRIIFDAEIPRFGVRLRAGGSARWVVQYAVGRRERRIVLGPVSALDAGKARSMAKDLLARIRLGEDPLAGKHEAAARASETVGAQLPRYLAHKRASLRPRSYSEVERHLLVHARKLQGRPLADFASDRRAIALLLAELAETSGATAANAVRTSLSAFCAWLLREGLLESNPIAGTNKAAQGGARDRLLDDAELKAIWNALDDDRYGAIVKLLALTGLRRDEIASLAWNPEVDLDAEMVRLPAARCKNKRPHDVPLSAPALAILKALPRTGELVFGRGRRGFTSWTISKRALDRKLGDAVAPWRLHDLRRVVSTAMHERLELAPHIVEACLGHFTSRSGVSGVYNRSKYVDQKRIALDRWADLLLSIVSGKKPATVVKMPRRK